MSDQSRTRYISADDFERLLDTLASLGPVYQPDPVEGHNGAVRHRYIRRAAGDRFTFAGFRPTEPLKQFYFAGRLKVAEYPAAGTVADTEEPEQITIVGAAACDVVSLKSLDAVFLQDEWTDIFYRSRRERIFLISADCEEPRDTCLCTRAGIRPYPEEGFDLNLSRTEGGYLVESGTERGNTLIDTHADLFAEPSEAALAEQVKAREAVVGAVDRINSEYVLTRSRHQLLEIQRESDEWFAHVATCIECGACLFACPTCHCFLLSDQKSGENEFKRFKAWDACSYAGYSRMAGGSSPRLGLMERFRHRYLHKFEYYPKNFGFEACTGCGRCIEGCMGHIDMRQVFSLLDKLPTGVGTP